MKLKNRKDNNDYRIVMVVTMTIKVVSNGVVTALFFTFRLDKISALLFTKLNSNI